MSRESVELGILSSLRFLGWLNFSVFAVAFISIKAASGFHVFLFYFTFLVCCIGTGVYYLGYKYLFKVVDKKLALTYFKPYRLGVFTVVCGLVLMYLMVFWGG